MQSLRNPVAKREEQFIFVRTKNVRAIVKCTCVLLILRTQTNKKRISLFELTRKTRTVCCISAMRYDFVAFSHADPHFLLLFSYYVAVCFFFSSTIVDRFENCSMRFASISCYFQIVKRFRTIHKLQSIK